MSEIEAAIDETARGIIQRALDLTGLRHEQWKALDSFERRVWLRAAAAVGQPRWLAMTDEERAVRLRDEIEVLGAEEAEDDVS